ncbi:hypothetical protein WICPIJ_000966 [Wickerhamomyces pijperi]|uniref:Uncharacterized protein n=1 Tax=Wickerhamomyces pijperi TaxID=599730 RepID=A0A9P8TRU8_WICPI|nr:hypothetical protein WICPIJ_000966 [Wickerhamomyces pijperi]
MCWGCGGKRNGSGSGGAIEAETVGMAVFNIKSMSLLPVCVGVSGLFGSTVTTSFLEEEVVAGLMDSLLARLEKNFVSSGLIFPNPNTRQSVANVSKVLLVVKNGNQLLKLSVGPLLNVVGLWHVLVVVEITSDALLLDRDSTVPDVVVLVRYHPVDVAGSLDGSPGLEVCGAEVLQGVVGHSEVVDGNVEEPFNQLGTWWARDVVEADIQTAAANGDKHLVELVDAADQSWDYDQLCACAEDLLEQIHLGTVSRPQQQGQWHNLQGYLNQLLVAIALVERVVGIDVVINDKHRAFQFDVLDKLVVFLDSVANGGDVQL